MLGPKNLKVCGLYISPQDEILTLSRIGEIYGNQLATCECYTNVLKETLQVDMIDPREPNSTYPKPIDDLEEILLRNLSKMVKVGKALPDDQKLKLATFLWDNFDVFAWRLAHMPSIDPSIITHKLRILPSYKPVCQVKRSLH